MSKVALKKYLYELTEHPLDYFLNYNMEEFAFNYGDTPAKSDAIIKTEVHEITDKVSIKVRSWLTVLGVSATKNFLERLLRNLPQYERDDSLIRELAYAISHELKKIDLINSENLSAMNVTTTIPTNLKKHEKLYDVNPRYELGLKIRQNIIVAREITRFSTFNFDYLLKICELFQVGEIVDIVNDKSEHSLTIILKENIGNINSIEVFKKHLTDVCPATYIINITN